jgi:hypothetical protein
LHAERNGVAVRAAVSIGQNEEENDRRRDQPKNEEADEDDGKDDRVRHRVCSSGLEPLFDLEPGLNVSQITFDPLDDHLGSCIYQRVV